MAFRLFSSAFSEGGWIPELHTCQRADISPSLEWMGEPPGTRSYALIVDDPDAPGGVWTHWLLYDIPRQTHTLAQGCRAGGLLLDGANDFGKLGYGGPCPPKGPRAAPVLLQALRARHPHAGASGRRGGWRAGARIERPHPGRGPLHGALRAQVTPQEQVGQTIAFGVRPG